MNYIFEAEGKTKAEAEQAALAALNLKEEDVTFEAVQSGGGFLGLVSRKPTIVRMYAKSVPVGTMIKGVVITLVRKMGLPVDSVEVFEDEESYTVEVESEDSAILIGKQGRTLDAIQFLANCMVDSRQRGNKRIIVDVAEYRERRKQRLTKLAKAVADRVARTGQSVLLEWMNPYERRVVHLALEPDERVTTRSDGNGVYKRVRVLPQQGHGPARHEPNGNRVPADDMGDDVDYNRKENFDDEP